MNDYKMKEIHETLCDLMTKFKNFMSGDLKDVDTKEAGEIADIIKDLAMTEKYCYESCYYKSVVEAMENGGDYDERYGYNTNRNSRGQYSSNRGSYGYRPMVDQEPYVDAYLRGNMGYIDPMSMGNAMDDIKSMWRNADPERRKSLKRELAAMVDDMD